MSKCVCGDGILNLGAPNCVTDLGVTSKLVFVQLYANDGTKNRIDLSSAFGETEFKALINQVDASKRWFITKAFENVDEAKAEPNFETMESDNKYFVSEGLRTFKGMIMNQEATMLGKLNSISCNAEIGVYKINLAGGIVGEYSTDGLYLEPIKISSASFNAMLEFAKDKTLQKIPVTFEYSRLVKDENLAVLTFDELNFNALAYNGLVDVVATVTTPVVTGFKVKLNLNYGTAKTKIPVVGLLITDFKSYSTGVAEKVRNVTDSADIAITSVTETPDGTYEFVFAAQTIADVIKVDLVKEGYEKTTITATLA